ncbi:MAG: hypothetical protein J6Y19_09330, partial [Kiritimatiellae bacterium]|nr:hypothetical protein [Kiritimatiellia bacterium]
HHGTRQTAGGLAMSDENFFEELAETRRKLWARSDGTIAGYAAMCERIAVEDREKFLAGLERKPAGRHVPSRRRKGAEYADASVVRESPVPGYGEGKTSDLARKGAEGDAR